MSIFGKNKSIENIWTVSKYIGVYIGPDAKDPVWYEHYFQIVFADKQTVY